jgi:tetratricopeptide (TPR) repeat protein
MPQTDRLPKGDLDQAIADYTEAIRRDPQDTTAYYNRGNAYRCKGEFDHAIADYTEVIRLDPKHPFAYCVRGFAYENKGDLDRAIADYKAALAVNSKELDAFTGAALIDAALAGRDRVRTDRTRKWWIPFLERISGSRWHAGRREKDGPASRRLWNKRQRHA